MDSNYIITTSGTFISTDELYHWGIKGMKWGIRRYQNSDGSLTAAGRKRYTNSDGTFNKKGEKYIAKETGRLKSEKTKLENQKKVNAQLDELAKMRKSNQDLEDEINGKKKVETEASDSKQKSAVSKTETYDMSDLTDQEVRETANRLSNEDRLKDLLTKRGYNVSLDERTEIDAMIESLSKEKKLAELKRDVEKLSTGKTETEKRIEILTQKRDIVKLEKEIQDNTPKKENKLAKFMNSQAGQNLANKLISAGTDALANAMTKSGKDNTDNKDNKDGKNKNQNNQNQNQNNQNKPKNSNSDNDAVIDAGAKAMKNAPNKTIGKEAKKVVKSVEKQQVKQAETEAKQAARELDKLVTKASKNSDASYYNSKAYEEKVDKMLAEMDDRAWDIYFSNYANK